MKHFHLNMHLFYVTVIINNFNACLPFSYVTFHLQTCKNAKSILFQADDLFVIQRSCCEIDML